MLVFMVISPQSEGSSHPQFQNYLFIIENYISWRRKKINIHIHLVFNIHVRCNCPLLPESKQSPPIIRIIVGMEAGHLGFDLWENFSWVHMCVCTCVYNLICSCVRCAKVIVFKGKYQFHAIWVFCNLAIITINNNNIVPTNLIADIWEQSNTQRETF